MTASASISSAFSSSLTFSPPCRPSPLYSSSLSRSSGVWAVSLCCPVFLTLCPVSSEETKQKMSSSCSANGFRALRPFLFSFSGFIYAVSICTLLLKCFFGGLPCGHIEIRSTVSEFVVTDVGVCIISCFVLVPVFIHYIFVLLELMWKDVFCPGYKHTDSFSKVCLLKFGVFFSPSTSLQLVFCHIDCYYALPL